MTDGFILVSHTSMVLDDCDSIYDTFIFSNN